MTLLRPILIPGLARVWRGPHTLQLGLDRTRAVLLDLPDPRTAALLDLLDGTRPERAVLSRMARAGVAHEDCRAVLDTLRAAGYVRSSPSLLPSALPDRVRRRLSAEAAALALAERGRLPAEAAPAPADRRTLPVEAPAIRRRLPTEASKDRRRVPAEASADRRMPPAGTAAPAAHGPSPAQTLRRRLSARVVISGRGRLGAPIAVALAEAGVGHVHPDIPDPAAGTGPDGFDVPDLGAGEVGSAGNDVRPVAADRPGYGSGHAETEATGSRRVRAGAAAEEIAAAIRRVAPETETRPIRRGTATLVIQLGHDQPVALLAAGHAARRQAHLAVAVREGAAVVGPLVPARGGPCLQCIDLHRRDRDPDWARMSAQLGSLDTEPCRVTTALAAAALAAAEALTYLDGGAPETLGAAVEVRAPGRMRRRTWPPHPRCDCNRRR